MRKITLNIEDSHFATVEAMARMKNVDPLEMIAWHIRQTAGFMAVASNLVADGLDDIAPLQPPLEGTPEERRAARLAMLEQGGPLWEGEPEKPKDGLIYEQELRAEW